MQKIFNLNYINQFNYLFLGKSNLNFFKTTLMFNKSKINLLNKLYIFFFFKLKKDIHNIKNILLFFGFNSIKFKNNLKNKLNFGLYIGVTQSILNLKNLLDFHKKNNLIFLTHIKFKYNICTFNFFENEFNKKIEINYINNILQYKLFLLFFIKLILNNFITITNNLISCRQ